MTLDEIIIYSSAGFLVLVIIIFILSFAGSTTRKDKKLKSIDKLTKKYTEYGFKQCFIKKKAKSYSIMCISLNLISDFNLGNMFQLDEIIKDASDMMNPYADKKIVVARKDYDVFYIGFFDKQGDTVISYYNSLKERLEQKYKLSLNIKPTAGISSGNSSDKLLQEAFDAWFYAERHHNDFTLYSSEVLREQSAFQTLYDNPSKIMENFVVYYQPKINVSTGNIEGAEALVRWQDANGKIVLGPNDFIPEFERNGFITKVDFFVLEETCKLLESFKKRNIDVAISVNFSRVDIISPNFFEIATSIIDKYQFDHSKIHFEITESSASGNEDIVTYLIVRLKEVGIHVELDDFGTGRSSLGSLSTSEFSYIKIDRQFVINNLKSDREIAILGHIINMCECVGKRVVVEGVENAQVVRRIRKMAKNALIQGFYFFKPLPRIEFERVLVDNNLHNDEAFIDIEYTQQEPTLVQVEAEEIPEEQEIIYEEVEVDENGNEIIYYEEDEEVEYAEDTDEELLAQLLEEMPEKEEPKPAPKPASKPTPKPASKPTPKQEAKPVTKPASKPVTVKANDPDILGLDDPELIKVVRSLKSKYQGSWKAEFEAKYPSLYHKYMCKKSYGYNVLQLPNIGRTYYNNVKNSLMMYKNVSNALRSCDEFIYEGKYIARMSVVNGIPHLYLALSPDKYDKNKYHQTDSSNIQAYRGTPLTMMLNSQKAVSLAIELIERLAVVKQLNKNPNYSDKDFVSKMKV